MNMKNKLFFAFSFLIITILAGIFVFIMTRVKPAQVVTTQQETMILSKAELTQSEFKQDVFAPVSHPEGSNPPEAAFDHRLFGQYVAVGNDVYFQNGTLGMDGVAEKLFVATGTANIFHGFPTGVDQLQDRVDAYGTDGTNVYHNGKKFSNDFTHFTFFIPDVSGNKLQDYYVAFAMDINYLYYNGKPIKGIDRNTVKFISLGSNKDCGPNPYLVDRNGIYFVVFPDDWQTSGVNAQRIEGADFATFVVLWTNYAKDKNAVYRGAEKTNDDPKIFNLESAYKACPMG